MYFLPPCFRLILTICYCFFRFFREQDIASGRSPDRNQADPFHAPTRLAKLYDFVPDIQDAMTIRALGPHAKLVKVISVWNSMGSWMIIPNDFAPCGVHEFLLHGVGEGELLFMMTVELDYVGRVWLQASFAFLTKYQQDLKYTWTVCTLRAGYTQSENCTIGGNYIQTVSGLRRMSGVVPAPVSAGRPCLDSERCSGGISFLRSNYVIQILPLHNQPDGHSYDGVCW